MVDEPRQDNPFRPPQASESLDEPLPTPGAPQDWSPFEAFTFAWHALLAHPLAVLAVFIAVAVQFVIPLVAAAFQPEIDPTAELAENLVALGVNSLTSLLNVPIAAWMNLGLARIALELCRGQRPGVERLFDTRGYLTALLGSFAMQIAFPIALAVAGAVLVGPGVALFASSEGSALAVVVLGVGLLAFLVVAAYFTARLAWWMCAIAYGAKGTFDALAMSFVRSAGQVLLLVLFYLMTVVLLVAAVFLGLCPGLFIGMVATLPFALAMVQVALMYGFLMRGGERPRAPSRSA